MAPELLGHDPVPLAPQNIAQEDEDEDLETESSWTPGEPDLPQRNEDVPAELTGSWIADMAGSGIFDMPPGVHDLPNAPHIGDGAVAPTAAVAHPAEIIGNLADLHNQSDVFHVHERLREQLAERLAARRQSSIIFLGYCFTYYGFSYRK